MRGRVLLPGLRASIVLALCLGLPVLAGVNVDEADAAFAAGDHPRALELYEQVLAEHPDAVRAWVRAGLLLSWSQRFDEALEHYDRALALDPDEPKARLERAKVLSWAGRFDEAVVAFDAYLDAHPDDAEALLARARCLAWSGRLAEAERAFRLILATDPDRREARLGVGYVYLWAGVPGRAGEQARALEAAYPDDDEVATFVERVDRALAPWLLFSGEQVDDTDENRLRVASVRAGVPLSRRVALEAGIARYDTDNRLYGDASIDRLDLALGIRPTLGQRVTVRAAYDRRESTAGDTDGDALGGVDFTWGLDRRWQLGATAQRESIRYSPQITDNGIVFDELSVRTRGRVASSWWIHGSYGRADFSDDNTRDLATAGVTWRLPVRRATLETGYVARFMDFSDDTGSGYFDPQDFLAHLLQFRAWDEWGARGNTWRFDVDFGVQSFELGGVETTNDRVVVVSGEAAFPVTRRLTLEARAGWGDYAALTVAGYQSREVALRLRWRLGG